ncbi:MAG TPA: cupredoxin family protein [Candidatus Limnocylindrales bacterium]|nr:cupredoxin family protein [Candidatus Limnocylindrales bacterium]
MKALAVAIAIAILVMVILMVVTGGQHGPGMHSGGSGSTTAPRSPSADGVGSPAGSAEASRTIELTASDSMAFDPASLHVAVGEVVTFVVTNTGQAAHEFTLGDEAMQREHADAMAHMPSDMHHDFPNSITVQPGHTERLTWRFGEAGTLEYACHEPGHYDAGMRGQIIVSNPALLQAPRS